MGPKWYLYGLIHGELEELPAGVGGRPVMIWPGERFGVLVSNLGAGPLRKPEPEDWLAHEQVVEAAMQGGCLLPFRFGTVTDEPGLTAFTRKYGERIRRKLAQVAGCVEVTLNVLDRPDPVAGTEEEAEADGAARRVDAGRAEAGRAEALREAQRRQRARRLLAELDAFLGGWAKERKHQLVPAQHLLLTVTHLIPGESVGPWAEAAASLKERYPDLDFVAGGPRPPYHFADVTATPPPDSPARGQNGGRKGRY